MRRLPNTDSDGQPREGTPILGLLIAVPIAIALWYGIYALVRYLA